ncbi:MAG: hypothetical protein QM820_57680 [Minicystis sp.]
MAQLDRAKLTSGIVLALTAACSTAGVHQSTSGGPGGNGGSVGHGGEGATTTTTSSTSVTTSTSIATGTGGFGGGMGGTGGLGGAGGSPVDTCNPPPDPSTLWAQKALSYPAADDVTLCEHVGKVLLVVNTAAA